MKMRIGIPVLVILVALAGSLALLARSAHGQAGGHAGHTMGMSDADMARMATRYWATHAPVGATAQTPASVLAVSDTVTVQNFEFDADHDLGTQIDSVRIAVGDQVVWKWLNGTHSVTSGAGSGDPGSGSMFDQPMDVTHPLFAFTFNNAGTFPYYCVFHEFFQMMGVVVVQDLTGVGDTHVGTGVGFASHPWPNPTHGSVSFRYDVRSAGRVRAEVLDAAGRRVAVVVDETQPAGQYVRTWDGRTRVGAAAAGRYFVRLTLPGYAGTQALSLTR